MSVWSLKHHNWKNKKQKRTASIQRIHALWHHWYGITPRTPFACRADKWRSFLWWSHVCVEILSKCCESNGIMYHHSDIRSARGDVFCKLSHVRCGRLKDKCVKKVSKTHAFLNAFDCWLYPPLRFKPFISASSHDSTKRVYHIIRKCKQTLFQKIANV